MKNFFLMALAIFSSSILVDQIAFSKTYEGNCANITFYIKGGKYIDDETFEIFYKVNNKEKFLYTASMEYLKIACVEGADKKEFLLLQERCGGSACSNYGEYKVIDPVSKRILLNQSFMTDSDDTSEKFDPEVDDKVAFGEKQSRYGKRNAKAVKKILGYLPPESLANAFCCTDRVSEGLDKRG